jgi:hypothetical protein
LLNLLIACEFPDLDTQYLKSVEIVYEQVEELKRTENQIIARLERETVVDVLSDDMMIEQLRHSRLTAETLTEHLR